MSYRYHVLIISQALLRSAEKQKQKNTYSTRNRVRIAQREYEIDMPNAMPTQNCPMQIIFHQLMLGLTLGPRGFMLGPRGFLDTNLLVLATLKSRVARGFAFWWNIGYVCLLNLYCSKCH